MADHRIPRSLRETIAAQEGVLTRQQVTHSGLPGDLVRSNVRAGRWQRVLPRVYATLTGPLTRSAQVWAALLYAGAGATVSHETAAELWGLVDQPGHGVHVTIGVDRRVRSLVGVQIHYSYRLDTTRHPNRRPPVTNVEETVLDLVDQAERPEDAEMWVIRACQRRRTTPERLGTALDARKKIRWRSEVQRLLVDVSTGAESPLEIAYAQRVERAHGLPPGRRQRRRRFGQQSRRSDVEYEDFRTVVELDGLTGHTEEGRFRDYQRDNDTSVRGRVTLRYGWTDTTTRSCHVAWQVAEVLKANGWQGRPRPCGPFCAVGELAA